MARKKEPRKRLEKRLQGKWLDKKATGKMAGKKGKRREGITWHRPGGKFRRVSLNGSQTRQRRQSS
jgi:hypothetical protein